MKPLAPMARILVAALLMLCAATAGAQQPRKFAVLSLLGDRLMLVQRVPATDTQPERNVVEFLDVDDRVFDQVVRGAVNEMLLVADRNNKPVLLDARDPALYMQQARILDDRGSVRKLVEGTGATHLILVTRLRHDAMLAATGGHLGVGTLEGLGFYIDRDKTLIASTTGEEALGYLGPFAYFKVSMYDVARGRLLREEAVTASRTVSAARTTTGDPWQALSSREKVNILNKMITEELGKKLPMMVRSVF